MQSHSLMPLVTFPSALKMAARQCMRRASSRGSDSRSWFDYRLHLTENLECLSERLKKGKWSPEPYRIVNYEFFTGKRLAITVPTVEDRIVHRAIRNVLSPILDTMLEPWVFGYLQGHSRISALRMAMQLLPSPWDVANIDIANVSGEIAVSKARDLFATCTSDGTLLELIDQILVSLPSPMAIGSGLSPMLIHLRLVPVDQELRHLRVVRFADNYVALADSAEAARDGFVNLCSALSKYGLSPAPSKSWVRAGVNPEDLFLLEV